VTVKLEPADFGSLPDSVEKPKCSEKVPNPESLPKAECFRVARLDPCTENCIIFRVTVPAPEATNYLALLRLSARVNGKTQLLLKRAIILAV